MREGAKTLGLEPSGGGPERADAMELAKQTGSFKYCFFSASISIDLALTFVQKTFLKFPKLELTGLTPECVLGSDNYSISEVWFSQLRIQGLYNSQ